MQEELKKRLSKDPNNGLLTYEYIANHIGSVDKIMPELVEIMIMVDKTGQFVVSTARYLHAIDPKKFANSIDKLIKAAIEKDRERVSRRFGCVNLGHRLQRTCRGTEGFRR